LFHQFGFFKDTFMDEGFGQGFGKYRETVLAVGNHVAFPFLDGTQRWDRGQLRTSAVRDGHPKGNETEGLWPRP
jgi:hypothetical protein